MAGPWAVCLHLCSHTQWVGDLSALTKENPPPPGTWFCSVMSQPAAVPSIANGRLPSSDPLTWPECHPCWAGGGVGSKQGPTGQLAGVPRWGCTLGLGDRDLICKFPLSPARENQTGSSSLWMSPFSQTFQRMEDLLEKLNADIREWDNWIQVVCLVGIKGQCHTMNII